MNLEDKFYIDELIKAYLLAGNYRDEVIIHSGKYDSIGNSYYVEYTYYPRKNPYYKTSTQIKCEDLMAYICSEFREIRNSLEMTQRILVHPSNYIQETITELEEFEYLSEDF